LLIAFLGSCQNKNHPATDVEKFFQENQVKVSLDDSFALKSKSDQLHLILAENKARGELVKVHIKNVKNHNEVIEEIKKTIVLLLSQFEFTIAPYPGQITDAANCGTKYHPRSSQKDGLDFLTMYSNERLALSICDSDDVNYKIETYFYTNLSENQLLIVDYYQNKNGANNSSMSMKDVFKNYQNVHLDIFKNIIQ
jgi:hypothetical protein